MESSSVICSSILGTEIALYKKEAEVLSKIHSVISNEGILSWKDYRNENKKIESLNAKFESIFMAYPQLENTNLNIMKSASVLFLRKKEHRKYQKIARLGFPKNLELCLSLLYEERGCEIEIYKFLKIFTHSNSSKLSIVSKSSKHSKISSQVFTNLSKTFQNPLNLLYLNHFNLTSTQLSTILSKTTHLKQLVLLKCGLPYLPTTSTPTSTTTLKVLELKHPHSNPPSSPFSSYILPSVLRFIARSAASESLSSIRFKGEEEEGGFLEGLKGLQVECGLEHVQFRKYQGGLGRSYVVK
ncbi:unnamed protein product [Moneuplotes crassus]|uniref:Uncharacterized protein n=1 Tax=Euplotes crassus TaxID=5936 RepID=A0AAD1XP93_EUPCR|nr:unnamed protein product [Moneuplotes crassus]